MKKAIVLATTIGTENQMHSAGCEFDMPDNTYQNIFVVFIEKMIC